MKLRFGNVRGSIDLNLSEKMGITVTVCLSLGAIVAIGVIITVVVLAVRKIKRKRQSILRNPSTSDQDSVVTRASI
jgi:hypothetical protein